MKNFFKLNFLSKKCIKSDDSAPKTNAEKNKPSFKHQDYKPSKHCRNLDSYGVVCVKCGRCGRSF